MLALELTRHGVTRMKRSPARMGRSSQSTLARVGRHSLCPEAWVQPRTLSPVPGGRPVTEHRGPDPLELNGPCSTPRRPCDRGLRSGL